MPDIRSAEQHCQVLIIGAGPTGLLLALWLAKLGIAHRIVDKDAGPGETSRAMAVHARTLEFYQQLGFAAEVAAKGRKIEHVAIRGSGRRDHAIRFGDLGAGLSPYPFILSFPQDEHEQVLIAQLTAAGITVERHTELVAFTQHEAGVNATLRTECGDVTVAACYLAGCDGARSLVRELSGIDLPGGTYAERFYVADAQANGEAARDGMNICLSGPDFCLAIPLVHTGTVRLIGIVPHGVTADPVRFEDVAGAVQRNTGLEISKVNWFSTYRVHHRVAARFRDRRAFLLGDAAHLHSPVGGQGMNTGLGDATNLAWKLAAVLAGRIAPAALDTYEPERIAFARSLVATTDRAFTLITDRGWRGHLWRTVVMGRLLPLVFRLPVLPRLAFARLSQIEIAYRDSALSQGRTARLHAGDRLPYATTAEGDNFAVLQSLDWQVHIYGDTINQFLREAVTAASLALHQFAWSPQAEAAGFVRNALYLIRPDGHIALADTEANPAALSAYVARWKLATRAA